MVLLSVASVALTFWTVSQLLLPRTAPHGQLRTRMNLPAIARAFAKLGIVDKRMIQAVVVALQGSVPGMKEWNICVVVPDLAGQLLLYSCMLGTLSAA